MGLPEIDRTDNFTEERSILFLHTRLKDFIQNTYENTLDQLWWNTVNFTERNTLDQLWWNTVNFTEQNTLDQLWWNTVNFTEQNTLDQLWWNTVNFTEQNNSAFAVARTSFRIRVVLFSGFVSYSMCTGQLGECVTLHRRKESRVLILLLAYLMLINIKISVFFKQSIGKFMNFFIVIKRDISDFQIQHYLTSF